MLAPDGIEGHCHGADLYCISDNHQIRSEKLYTSCHVVTRESLRHPFYLRTHWGQLVPTSFTRPGSSSYIILRYYLRTTRIDSISFSFIALTFAVTVLIWRIMHIFSGPVMENRKILIRIRLESILIEIPLLFDVGGQGP